MSPAKRLKKHLDALRDMRNHQEDRASSPGTTAYAERNIAALDEAILLVEREILNLNAGKDLIAEFWKDLRVGNLLNGIVHSSTKFGLFVDIGPGGIRGLVRKDLVPQSLFGYAVGDAIEVKVTKLNIVKQRIELEVQ